MKSCLVLISFMGLFTCSFNITAMGGPGATYLSFDLDEDSLEQEIAGLPQELQEVVIIKTLDSILKERFPRKKAARNAFIRRFLQLLPNPLLRRSNRKYFLNRLAHKFFLAFGKRFKVPDWYLIKYFGERGKEYGWKEKYALRKDILDYSFSLRELLSHNQFNRKVENGTLNLSSLRLNNLDGLLKIPKIKTVTKLMLHGNRLKVLTPEIVQLKALEELYLDNNELQEFPTEIVKLASLNYLSLFNNQLAELPTKIGELPALEELYLNRNQLKKFTLPISSLPVLKELNLSNNKLQELSKQISKLKNLRVLNLEGNQDLKGQEAKIRKMLPGVEIFF